MEGHDYAFLHARLRMIFCVQCDSTEEAVSAVEFAVGET
jgi:hypothetical protein